MRANQFADQHDSNSSSSSSLSQSEFVCLNPFHLLTVVCDLPNYCDSLKTVQCKVRYFLQRRTGTVSATPFWARGIPGSKPRQRDPLVPTSVLSGAKCCDERVGRLPPDSFDFAKAHTELRCRSFLTSSVIS